MKIRKRDDSMHESIIRSKLHSKYLKRAHECMNTRVVDEMGVFRGTSRVDVAVINGKLEGYEIKGPLDTLDRLNNQVELYSKVFQKMTLVSSEKHLDQAIGLIPDWWGITIVYDRSGEPVMKKIRPAKINKSVDVKQVANLLWKEELVSALNSFTDIKVKTSWNRSELSEKLAENISQKTLYKIVLDTIKNRRGWL